MEPPAPPQPGDTSGSVAASSSGTERMPKERKVPYAMTPTKIEDVDGLSIGHFTLTKPSNTSHQDGCLYILDGTDVFSMSILRVVNHPNILHLQCVMKSDSSSVRHILVDGYSHGLRTEISKDARDINAIKLEKIRSLIRQLIEAIDVLRTKGLYHGNLNIGNTYYDKSSGLLKLGNFKEKEGNELERSQLEDWTACGIMINEIADILKDENPNVDLCLMEDLAHFLKNHSLSIEHVKDGALDEVFFWDKRRRTSFFVHAVVKALKINEFRQRVELLDFISNEWNLNDHEGVLTAMNKKRVREKKLEYTGGPVSYVQFVSGAYTHESELKRDGLINEIVVVDDIIPPRLCLELVRIARQFKLHIC